MLYVDYFKIETLSNSYERDEWVQVYNHILEKLINESCLYYAIIIMP